MKDREGGSPLGIEFRVDDAQVAQVNDAMRENPLSGILGLSGVWQDPDPLGGIAGAPKDMLLVLFFQYSVIELFVLPGSSNGGRFGPDICERVGWRWHGFVCSCLGYCLADSNRRLALVCDDEFKKC